MRVNRLRFAALILLAAAAIAADRKKPPDIEILEASAHRSELTISVEGRVKNTGEKPVAALKLAFTFFAPGKQPLTTQKGEIDEPVLAKGSEASFRMELNAPPRAVEFTIDATDANGRDLRVGGAGPFPIE